MAKFKVMDREFETQPLRGRKGRTSTNFLLKRVSGGSSSGIDTLVDLTTDEAFLGTHLPILVGKEEAAFIDENATTSELLRMINAIAEEMSKAFEGDEVGAALKNSQATPEGEDQ